MMRKILLIATIGILTFEAAAADDDVANPPKSAAVKRAIAKRARTVEQAEGVYRKAALAANATFDAELKSALDEALEAKDLDEANAIAAMIKDAGRIAPTQRALKQQLDGSTWVQPEGHRLTLNADGTMSHSIPRYKGKWHVLDERTILIRFDEGTASVWTFDEALKSFTGVYYMATADQRGTRGIAKPG